ncbi:CCA tRNA nucleotidyltransferase [Paenibacillus sp. JCM 10914]|uniref:CCA tRNA nucleotidyltransferase n=1 Tax=Paenibacillus sp. JCM 10914 TaxID=1236974 RepID=UPI0003CC8229|nr:CCA tRNA nucleotidyltransferase [Paenibacillus sp. JCM 10914]GAE04701.1 tRNA nucleotidyltransferase [Paenibacillus sp. JCM 10914]
MTDNRVIQWHYADPEMAIQSANVIGRLLQAGYEAYWVGGCVRDEYMRRPVHDMDITTSARPEKTCALFQRVVPTGIKHGTVTVLMNGQAFEVTTYRVESGYEDHRHPTEVAFVSDVNQDLTRRDFTMNAMARGLDGTWVDPFNGRRDIDQSIIRCVGQARVRFREDALRMVRCIRFASVFGFSIAHNTWRGIIAERDTFSWIAMERIRSEFDKIITGPSPLAGFEMFIRSGLYARMKSPFPYTGHDQRIMDAIPCVPDQHVSVRWALVLLACGITAEAANPLLRAWTFSNKQRAAILDLLVFQEKSLTDAPGAEVDNDQLGWIQSVLTYGDEAAERWLIMQRSLMAAGAHTVSKEQLQLMERWLHEMPVRSLKDLSITGSELLHAMSMRGGPWLGTLLNQLLHKVATGKMNNDRESLIEEAKRVLRDYEGT